VERFKCAASCLRLTVSLFEEARATRPSLLFGLRGMAEIVAQREIQIKTFGEPA